MSTDSDPPNSELAHASPAEGLPVSPSLELVSDFAQTPTEPALVDRRVVFISLLSILLGLAAGGISVVFMRLIALVTNLAFYQQISLETVSPAGNHLGLMGIVVPVIGGGVLGFIGRLWTQTIPGHRL